MKGDFPLISTDIEVLWRTALADIELQISPANFATWFRHTKILAKQGGEIIIGVPSGFTKEWLENKYHKYILRSLRALDPEIKEVCYAIGSVKLPSAVPGRTRWEKGEGDQNLDEHWQLPIDESPINKITNLNLKYTFDSFVVGPSNEIAYAAAQAILSQPGTLYNPFFIYGGVGLGKTHLLHALGNALANQHKKVLYLTSEQFVNDFVFCLRNKRMGEFKERYRKLDVFLVDDVQFIAGKETTQEEFFHTFNALYSENKQVVLSSDRLPQAIPTLEDRLRSRFEGGMITDVGSPTFEMRLAILQKKCRDKNISLSQETLHFIAEHVQRNVRELEGALNVLRASPRHSSLDTLSAEEARNILKGILKRPNVNIHYKSLIQTVADFYQTTEKDMLGKNRRKEVAHARQVAMYAMRELLHSSYPFIGRVIGGRDHTTVMHAYQKIHKEIQTSEDFREEFSLIRQKISLV